MNTMPSWPHFPIRRTAAPHPLSLRGKPVDVPSMQIHGRTILVAGSWFKVASVHDEAWLPGDAVDDPDYFIAMLKDDARADIFTFAQKLPDVTPRYSFLFEWDNAAAIPITTYKDWLTHRVEYDVRKGVKKASRLGVLVCETEFNDDFVRAIMEIYNESPVRQGGRFTHYGKDFDTVKREHVTYLDRATFIGAYHDGKLIGFVKMVYVDDLACTMQVISMIKYRDKKPTNALLAKAVEICALKGISHLVYGRYIYGNKTNSALTEFKRRNGFAEVRFPRYYVPLTHRGKIAITLRLHRGILGVLPPPVIDLAISVRSRFYATKLHLGKPTGAEES